mmetsp:Transcript_95875/g.140067  ORF Transcript_95875/g.140067 Transcript_95875/m.140067 type:complete len:93 (-) Transcript_95875:156-434(-)
MLQQVGSWLKLLVFSRQAPEVLAASATVMLRLHTHMLSPHGYTRNSTSALSFVEPDMGRLGKGIVFFDFSERERELFGFGLAGVGLRRMTRA